MGWNTSDRIRIAKYLGFDFDQAAFTKIDGQLAAVERLDASIPESVQLLLDRLDKLDTEMNSAAPWAGASFVSNSGGSRQFFRGARMEELRLEGRRMVGQLSRYLDLDLQKDVFSLRSGMSYGQLRRG